MKLYCYAIHPIDFWPGALTGEQLMRITADGCDGNWEWFAQFSAKVHATKSAAEAAFEKIGWEGDIREGPYYFILPDVHTTCLGYVVKQDNNGATFVASPHPLPHLGKLPDLVTEEV